MKPLNELPANLPVPIDDGGCDHLIGRSLPDLDLPTTEGVLINLAHLPGRLVIYLYPMTGRPDTALPDGWDQIPGARGCTPQSCGFRDHHAELQALDTRVFGMSTQESDYQQEAAARLHLPFPLISDARLEFLTALALPTMRVDGRVLSKRITLVSNNGVIEKCFYPVFPPDQNAAQVVAYLKP